MSYLIGTHQSTLHSMNRYSDISTYKARTTSENPTIPSPDVFTDLNNAEADDFPTAAQCAVHLELLEAFHALKVRVVGSSDLDRTFGLAPKTKIVYRRKYSSKLRKYINQSVRVKDPDWEARRGQKWPRYLDFAAERFVEWAKTIDASMAKESSQTISDRAYTSKSPQARLPYVPPLDILMMWHTYLLNPSFWHNYCQTRSLNYLFRVPFPWKAIHDCIESQGTISRSWTYSLPDKACKYLKDNGIEVNLCDYLEDLGKPESPEALPDEAEGVNKPTSPESPSNEASEDSEPVAAVSIESPEDQSVLLKSLIANVTRQLVFVDKMHAQLWIRSPALAGTLTRAVERYENYLELFQLYPGKMLVPTLDIDLVWHTHQLSAKNYRTVTESRCGRFINHNDKLGKPTLETGMKDTQELFQVHFGQAYSICLCWDCEAIASALEVYDENDTAEMTDTLTDKVSKKVLRNVQYNRAVEYARRRGDALLPILL
ncbi:hypothetical protein B0J13DRAFT_85443 [Dactylonectria estremocensis]|uniref:Uncharacterized protein n=1 Tax=Dactylonectria estremocensis TaxID=1079267 RepID=A0A9P9EB04_9HYPO|nr:hypothetical protein B0J13DRAFT_85443 [Dactylonectria estremocensis]